MHTISYYSRRLEPYMNRELIIQLVLTLYFIYTKYKFKNSKFLLILITLSWFSLCFVAAIPHTKIISFGEMHKLFDDIVCIIPGLKFIKPF